MVVVIDKDERRLYLSEAILAKLRFAVAPFATAEQALLAMQALRPEIIVAGEDELRELDGRLPTDRDGEEIPLLALTPDLTEPAALIEALREVIARHRTDAS